MNSAVVTTGVKPLTVGSTELFQAQPFLDSLPWDLTGGSAQLLLTDPDGTTYTLNATVQNRGAVASWTVPDVPGTWVRAWKFTVAGLIQYSQPIVFTVIESPGTPF